MMIEIRAGIAIEIGISTRIRRERPSEESI